MLLDLLGSGGTNASRTAATPESPLVVLPTRADSACDQQWSYETSQARFNTCCGSRRMGKTNGAIRRAARVLAKPGTWVHYVNLIRRNARKQFFMPLVRRLGLLGWNVRVNLSDMLIETPWGSFLQAFSVPDMGSIGTVKGDRSNLFMLDECQEPAEDLIEALIDVAATPMTTDYGGMIDLLGTVPEVEPCFFSEALDSVQWAHFHWTMFDHDLPESRDLKRARVEEVLQARGLSWEHPIVQREYLGKRVRDASKFVYDFDHARNTYDVGELAALARAA